MDDGVTMYLRITDLGRQRVRDLWNEGYSAWPRLDGDSRQPRKS